MAWEILSVILSLIAAGVSGYTGYIWIHDTADESDGNTTLNALAVAVLFAFIGYFFWFAILICYFGVKLLSAAYIMLIQIVELCYRKVRRWIRKYAKIQSYNTVRINKIQR